MGHGARRGDRLLLAPVRNGASHQATAARCSPWTPTDMHVEQTSVRRPEDTGNAAAPVHTSARHGVRRSSPPDGQAQRGDVFEAVSSQSRIWGAIAAFDLAARTATLNMLRTSCAVLHAGAAAVCRVQTGGCPDTRPCCPVVGAGGERAHPAGLLHTLKSRCAGNSCGGPLPPGSGTQLLCARNRGMGAARASASARATRTPGERHSSGDSVTM